MILFLVQGRDPGLWLWPGAEQVLASCAGARHCLMSVQGGQWAHHGSGHQQSPGGEWSVVCVIVVSIFSIYPYLFTLRRWIGLSLNSFPVIRTVSHYLINIACQVTSESVDTIYPVTAYTLASVYDEIFAPLTCCQWLPVVMWVTWQCQWLWRTLAEAVAVWTPRSLIEVTLGGSRKHRQPPLAELMKCLPLLDEISHERTTNGTTLRAGTHDFLGKQIILWKS